MVGPLQGRTRHDGPVTIFAWLVLTAVFVDELLVMAAFGVWGWQADPRWLLVWLLPLLAMLVWFCRRLAQGAVRRPGGAAR